MYNLNMGKKWLLIIIAIALFLRIFKISSNSLYGDELTIVYDAYSLLKTGYDSTGKSFPITFEMGAGRPGGYVYGSIPFVALFGPSALGVRGLSILSGIGIVLLLYLLGKKLFSERVGIMASLIIAVSPWDISLSRAGFEAHFALFLALLGVVLFIFSKDNKKLLIPWAISWGLAIHTYPTYKLTLPLLFLGLVWYSGGIRKIANKYFYLGFLVLVLFSSLALWETFFGISEQRFLSINIFNQEDIRQALIQKINYERTITELPSGPATLFHNKPVEYISMIKNSYLSNFSAEYLFIKGDENPRHNPSEMGVLYLIELPLIFLGLFILWQKNNKLLGFLLLWLSIVPLATSLLGDQHSLRNAFMLPLLALLSAIGLDHLFEVKQRKKYLLLTLLFVIWFAQFIFFFERTYFLAPNKFAAFWSYPAKKASEIAIIEKDNYDYVFLSDRIDNIEFAYSVYARLDPKLVIDQNLEKTNFGGYSFRRFDNVYIGSLPQREIQPFIENLNESTLFIGNFEEGNFLDNYQKINYRDQTEMLVLKGLERSE